MIDTPVTVVAGRVTVPGVPWLVKSTVVPSVTSCVWPAWTLLTVDCQVNVKLVLP